jgi:hypothetical protein
VGLYRMVYTKRLALMEKHTFSSLGSIAKRLKKGSTDFVSSVCS